MGADAAEPYKLNPNRSQNWKASTLNRLEIPPVVARKTRNDIYSYVTPAAVAARLLWETRRLSHLILVLNAFVYVSVQRGDI